MVFDGTIHLGDVLVAVPMALGGVWFLLRIGSTIEHLNGGLTMIRQMLDQHEKRLDGIDEDLRERRQMVRSR